MRKKVKLFCLFLLLSLLWVQLSAELPMSITDVVDLGQYSFPKTIQLDDTHYVSFGDIATNVYEIEGGQLHRIQHYYDLDGVRVVMRQLLDNKIYTVTASNKLRVYQYNAPDLSITGEYDLAHNDFVNSDPISVQVLGNRLVVARAEMDDFFGFWYTTWLYTYDITELETPVLLASNAMPSSVYYFNTILEANDGYYLFGSPRGVYYSPDLIDIPFIDVLPGLSENDYITYPFVCNDVIYACGSGDFGSFLVRFGYTDSPLLNLDWMITLPVDYVYDIKIEPNRVLFSGNNYYPASNKVLCYTPSENMWTLNFARIVADSYRLFPDIDGYIGFSGDQVSQLDQALNPVHQIYQGRALIIESVINNRYVLLGGMSNIALKSIYDLQNSTWLDFSTTSDFDRRNMTRDGNQILFGSSNNFTLLSLHNDGTYDEYTFTLDAYLSQISVYNDRMLVSMYTESGLLTSVYTLSEGVPVEQFTQITDGLWATSFILYDENHYIRSVTDFSDNSSYTSFHRINANNVEQIAVFEGASNNFCFVLNNRVVPSTNGLPMIDISDPDNPVVCGILNIPMTSFSNISYDKVDRYIIGYSHFDDFYVLNNEFVRVATFKAKNAQYIGRNQILVQDGSNMFIMEHDEIISNDDPHVPFVPSILGLAYPNPFKNSVKLQVEKSESGSLVAEVFNLRGQKVRSLYDGFYAKGTHILDWDSRDDKGSEVASGLYFLRVKTQGHTETRKLLRLK